MGWMTIFTASKLVCICIVNTEGPKENEAEKNRLFLHEEQQSITKQLA